MPCKWAPLFTGALLENLEGVRLLGVLREKKIYLGSFLGPRGHMILSVGVIWNFSKGTGLSRVDIRLWGTKDPSIRPR
jgi:hypothetical protein